LQVLNTHHRVVLADGSRGFVQIVAAGVADTGVDFLDFGFRLFPVVAELLFAAHGPLGLCQRLFLAFETIERGEITAVAQRGKRAMPMSMPTIEVDGCAGVSTSRSVWMLTNHLPQDWLTVTFLI